MRTRRSHGTRDRPDWPSVQQVDRAAQGFPLVDADRRATGSGIPFFKDWVEHPDRDTYWVDIDGHGEVDSLKAPALLMAGWYDPFLPTQLADYMRIRKSTDPIVASHSRLIIGPWTHASEVIFPDGTQGENFRKQSVALSLPWFDENSGIAAPRGSRSSVRLFVMGKNNGEMKKTGPWLEHKSRHTS